MTWTTYQTSFQNFEQIAVRHVSIGAVTPSADLLPVSQRVSSIAARAVTDHGSARR